MSISYPARVRERGTARISWEGVKKYIVYIFNKIFIYIYILYFLFDSQYFSYSCNQFVGKIPGKIWFHFLDTKKNLSLERFYFNLEKPNRFPLSSRGVGCMEDAFMLTRGVVFFGPGVLIWSLGENLLLMAEILHQLRLVVFPIICFHTSQVVQDFSHQQ